MAPDGTLARLEPSAEPLDTDRAIRVSWDCFAANWAPLLAGLLIAAIPLKAVLIVFTPDPRQPPNPLRLLAFIGVWCAVWIFLTGPSLVAYFRMQLDALDSGRARWSAWCEGLAWSLSAIAAQLIKGFLLGVWTFLTCIFIVAFNVTMSLGFGVVPLENFAENPSLMALSWWDITYFGSISAVLSLGIFAVITYFWFVEIALADRITHVAGAFYLSYRLTVVQWKPISWLMTVMSAPVIPGLAIGLAGSLIPSEPIVWIGVILILAATPWILLSTVEAYRQIYPASAPSLLPPLSTPTHTHA